MNQSLGGFRAALLAGWVALSAAGLLYARMKGIPLWAAVPILAAFLVEYPFYLLPGFPAAARLFERRLPVFLIVSFVAPYVIYASNTGQFRWWALAQLAALATALCLWYVVLPPAPAVDGVFLVLVAAVVLRKYLEPIYSSPISGLRLEILGHLALIRLCAMVMLFERNVSGIGFGFLPSRRECGIGIRYFLYFLVVGIPLAWATGLVHFGPVMPLWKIAATFLGAFWVLALSEEFFFRGVLQQWLTQWTGSPTIALAGAAMVFGSVHLGFRHFPNWRFALAATVAGCFYGRAFSQAKSIRAGMVTHALVVTMWRALFV
jgi:membrane protease YdiL (CAAX protease family)